MKLFFWRRLAAGWIDIFVVHSGVSFLLALCRWAGLRVAFEPLFAIAAICYGAGFVWLNGKTVGKGLMGLRVETTSGEVPSVGRAVLREAVGKWAITVLGPIVLGRLILRGAWIPTAFEMLLAGLALVLSVLFSLVARRPWHDLLGGTVVRRAPGVPALPRSAWLALVSAAVLGFGTTAVEYAILGRVPSRLMLHQNMRSTTAYVNFLERNQTRPVDYVLGLFDNHDVVVLCERLHPESTQWDFIFDLVRDPRFGDRVGHVFTEYGNSRIQADLEDFLTAEALPETEVHDRALHLVREWSVWPVWNNSNFHTYLSRLHRLNRTLPPGKRIRHYFTDVAEDWQRRTPDNMREHWGQMADRDEYMARRVIDTMRAVRTEPGRSGKCLVVMNFRHAFDLTGRAAAARRNNVYEFLKDEFGHRAANVLLNTSVLQIAPIAGGVWDAAFRCRGNRPVGFDLANSPFGRDRFDLFMFAPSIQARFRYDDVFDGFVFTHPLKDQFLEVGIPGYFNGFEPEMRRRAALVGKEYAAEVEQQIHAEQAGRASTRQTLMDARIETCASLGLLSFASVGLLIGLGRIGVVLTGIGAALKPPV